MKRVLVSGLAGAWVALAASGAWAQGAGKPVYRCPGPPVLYTDTLTTQEAKDRGCNTIEGAPLTIVQTRKPTPAASGPSAAPGVASVPRSADSKVDPVAQRARDSDSRRILESELRREEEKLAVMRKEFNNGEPERVGGERNYAKYQERVAEMRAAIVRKESDVTAIKRELSKLGP
ncbi:MAG TPA: hypothetical protein VIW70_06015 [Rubrivivax sp.]